MIVQAIIDEFMIYFDILERHTNWQKDQSNNFRGYYIVYKKLQAIYLMLYKRYKTAKIKKYKHEHVLAYTFNLSSVARINV